MITGKKSLLRITYFVIQRVKTRLKNKNDGVMPWCEYTYGEIASKIVAESAYLYNTLRIQKQLSEERAKGKIALGDLCEQYGFTEIPKAHHKKKVIKESKRYKKYRHKSSKGKTSEEMLKTTRFSKRKSSRP